MLEQRDEQQQPAERRRQQAARQVGVGEGGAATPRQRGEQEQPGDVPARLRPQRRDVRERGPPRLRPARRRRSPTAVRRSRAGTPAPGRGRPPARPASAVRRSRDASTIASAGSANASLKDTATAARIPAAAARPPPRPAEQRGAQQQRRRDGLGQQLGVLAQRPWRHQAGQRGAERKARPARQPPDGDEHEQRGRRLAERHEDTDRRRRVAQRQRAGAEQVQRRRLGAGEVAVQRLALEQLASAERVHAVGVLPVALALPRGERGERGAGEHEPRDEHPAGGPRGGRHPRLTSRVAGGSCPAAPARRAPRARGRPGRCASAHRG